MADETMPAEMLEAYFQALGRNGGGNPPGGATPASAPPPDPMADALERGREIARRRFDRQYNAAAARGNLDQMIALENRIERDATTIARRETLRAARGATAGERPRMPQAPGIAMAQPGPEMPSMGIDYGAPAPNMPAISQIPRNALLASGDEDFVSDPMRGAGAMPQSRDQEAELAAGARFGRGVAEVTGFNPAMRSSNALMEGRPLEAAAHAAVAAFPYRPLGAAGALGTTYGAAIASDVLPGMFGTPSADAQQSDIPSQFIPMDRSAFFQANRPARKSLEELQSEAEARVMSNPAYQGLIEDRQSTRARRMIEEARKNAEIAYNKAETGRAGEEERLDTAYQTYLTNLNQQREEFMRSRTSAGEYNRAVATAERARDEWLARDRRFSDTNLGQVMEAAGGAAPIPFGFGAGALTRAAGRAMGHGDGPVAHYVAPAIGGFFGGATAANIPQAYNALYTETDNPRRRAYEEMALALPQTHPRRQEFRDFAASLPQRNPVQETAAQELAIGPTARRVFVGGLLEGAPAGWMGSEAVRLLAGRTRTGGSPPVGPSGNSPGPSPQPQPPIPTALPSQVERSARPNPDDPRGHWVPPGSPPAAGEVETWVSPAGRNSVTRDAHGYRDSKGRFSPAPPRNYRRISSVDEPAVMPEGRNALLG